MQDDSELPPAHEHSPVPLTWMRPHDVGEVVRLHVAALPPSFFSRLGGRFLREYHRCYAVSPFAGGIVATHEGVLCGFVVGSLRTPEHAAWTLRRRGLRLAVLAAVSLIVRPRLLVFFLRTRVGRYARGLTRRVASRRAGATVSGPAAAAPAVLAHVAVAPAWRGRGLGESLVRSFCAAAWQAGAADVELVTLAGPRGAAAFYTRLGFTQTAERVDEDGTGWTYFRTHRSG